MMAATRRDNHDVGLHRADVIVGRDPRHAEQRLAIGGMKNSEKADTPISAIE
jgi:hypothetical protein